MSPALLAVVLLQVLLWSGGALGKTSGQVAQIRNQKLVSNTANFNSTVLVEEQPPHAEGKKLEQAAEVHRAQDLERDWKAQQQGNEPTVECKRHRTACRTPESVPSDDDACADSLDDPDSDAFFSFVKSASLSVLSFVPFYDIAKKAGASHASASIIGAFVVFLCSLVFSKVSIPAMFFPVDALTVEARAIVDAISILAVTASGTALLLPLKTYAKKSTTRGVPGNRVQHGAILAAALCVTGFALYKGLSSFSAHDQPDPFGLFCGILTVLISHVMVVVYYYTRRVKNWTWFCRTGNETIQKNHAPKKSFSKELLAHLTRWESFFLLVVYLSVTWMFNMMPREYYNLDSHTFPMGLWRAVSYKKVLVQFVVVDCFMFVMHFAEHIIRPLYRSAHKPHHAAYSPCLFDAFKGHVLDTTFMIVVPLFATAQLVPDVNAWEYMAFGGAFANFLVVIHSEYRHPLDSYLPKLGLMTAADHHVHHATGGQANFAHFFSVWDRAFSIYRSPDSVPGFRLAEKAAKIDATKKQGAYGKIQIHQSKISLGAIASNPLDFAAAIRLKLRGVPGAVKGPLPSPAGFPKEDVAFCSKMLDKVSRSFAAVIRQLPPSMSLTICVFYLVLRALDTVEDDMDEEKFENLASATDQPTDGKAVKFRSLTRFFRFLENPNDPLLLALMESDIGEADEAHLLQNFDGVIRVHKKLAPAHQEVISDITKKMGHGMAVYCERDLVEGTKDVDDYDRYCHIVAGLVGEGLSRLFAISDESGLKPYHRALLVSRLGMGSLSSNMGLL